MTNSYPLIRSGPFNQGRLRSLAWSGVDTRIAGAGALGIFNEATPPFTRKTTCWAYGVTGMSSLCAWNRGMTLVTPEIALYALHFNPSIGESVTFVAEDGSNTNYTRTISAVYSLGSPLTNASGDIGVALLSSALPGTVKPARLFTGDLIRYLPATDFGIPLFETNGANQATVNNWNRLLPPTPSILNCAIPATTPRSSYYVTKITGDSGRGMGVIINGEYISVGSLSVSNQGGTGWPNWLYLSAIQAGIVSLGSATTLSTLDPATLH